MRHLFGNVRTFALVGATAFLAFSCTSDAEEELENEQDQKLDQSEVKTILETDELSSAADSIVQSLFNNRESGKSAKDDACYTADYTDTGFTVSFDQCTVEEEGEVLNGSLAVVYDEQADSFAYTVTYNDLNVGGIGMNGTRSFSYEAGEENSIVFDVVTEMSLTLEDDSVITEKGNKSFIIAFDEEFGSGVLSIGGEWVVNANDDSYAINVTSDLQAQFGCDYIGKGLMELSKNGLTVDVDFGDGTCDDLGELVYPDGTIETITLKD